MRIIKVFIANVKGRGYNICSDDIMFYIDKSLDIDAFDGDIYLPDYFEDWENPTAIEISLFELANGYKIEFV